MTREQLIRQMYFRIIAFGLIFISIGIYADSIQAGLY